MNRLASNGETTAPCGVPLSRLVREPSGSRNGAFNHLSTYSRTHFWSSCTWCATALTMRSQGHGVKELRDIEVDNPVVLEAPFPAHRDRIQRPPSGTVGIGVVVEQRVHDRLQH